MQTLQNRGSIASTRAATTSTRRAAATVRAGKGDDIYIGFVKEEGFGDRTGKKGRFIKDDPRKYPNKDNMGPLLGVTGGWAGGEAGLWELREQYKADPNLKKKPAPTKAPKANPTPGKAPIYVGFGKEVEDFEARKQGLMGRVIYDDPYKYPNKEDIGPLPGATGGFAGGEVGLKNFAATGELRVRRPGQPGPKQFTPLTIAGYMALAGLLGGAALAVAGEGSIEERAPRAATLLGTLAASGTSIWLLFQLNAFIKESGRRFAEGVQKAAVLSAFIGVVAVAAYVVLEN